MIKLLRFLSPYKGRVTIMIILLCIQVFGTLYIPTLTANIVNDGIVPGNLDFVWRTGFNMILVSILVALFAIGGTYLSTAIFAKMSRDIRNTLFRKSQSLSINEFNQFGPASMITRCTNDISQIQQAFIILIQMVLPAPIMTVVGLILAFSKDKMLAFLIVATMALVIMVTLIVGLRSLKLFEQMQNMLDRITRKLRENIIGVRVIRAFNRTLHERSKVDGAFEDYANTAIKVNKIFAVMMPVVMGIMNLCTVLIVLLGGQRVANGTLQIGDIMALIEYSTMILMYLVMGSMVIIVIPRAQTCAARINAVLEVAPETVANQFEKQKNVSNAKLAFNHVEFQYAGAEEPVLTGISFETRQGETTAIIGGTGSGKSTIASLIPRLYEIQRGSITVDGIAIANMPEKQVRAKIGYVPQKSFLFSGTIAENLRDGDPDATMEELRHAAKIAQIDEFIDSLEDGYDSFVSQGGSNFSGGQKQRLCIARALVKQADIYVFDDSFSALDFKTDAKLRAMLKTEVKNAAVILVAQRVSTIMDANQIVVLDEGKIVGIGTHKELMTSCPVYQQIARSQLSEEELA